MSARKKLNGLYLSGCAVFGSFIGLVFASWWAFGAACAIATLVQITAGNIRLSGAHR
jgi:hypothetical protein